MKASSRLLAIAALTAGTGLGCGAEFDPPSEIKSLRVLAVQKSKPYASPGDEVQLELHYHDGSPDRGREIQRAFIGGCVNPPGDLYYGCFAQLAETLASGQLPPISEGDTFSVTLPQDIVSGRQGPFEPGQPRYGLYIVFFMTCAGRLDFVTELDPTSTTGLPVRCLDENDQPLGSEDFVVGYSSIYSFPEARNVNPDMGESSDEGATFRVGGVEGIPADCVASDCLTAPDVEVDCVADPERCIAACADDGDDSCPAIEVEPALDPEIVERDDVSSDISGLNLTEQMWVNYYVDRGGISDVRLLNDVQSGWNEKYRAQLRAPKEPGAMRVWAVAHDNRGGMNISRLTLNVVE